MRDKEFIVKVNKYGKRTHQNIRAISHRRTMSKIIITDILGNINEFDRSEYESHIIRSEEE